MADAPRWDDWDEPSLERHVVERRRQPRGFVRGLALTVEGDRRLEAVEASSKGFFAHLDDPDAFRLGETHEIEVVRGSHRFRCRVEVVRKELVARTGVALR